ncbi:MAG: peptidylprolyl isomerase [Allosphingosinicella sp.]
MLLAFLFAGAVAAQPAVPPPPPPLDPENTLHLDLSTGGRVTIQLRPDVAPAHVERIKTLTRRGFYDGLVFHRVIEGFMAQGGDPTGDGTGGSELPDLKAEFNGLPHVRGAVAAARTEAPDTANSQFFIMFTPRFALDGKYTVFGRVVAGMNYVDAINRGEPPALPSKIVRASIGADNVAALSAEQLKAAAAAAPTAPAAPLVATLLGTAAAGEAPAADAGAADAEAGQDADAPAAEAAPEDAAAPQ